MKNSDNVGITESLNKGLKRARGKYIARLDADDYSYPDRLERQVELMEKENLDLLAHTFNIKNSEVTFLEENRNNYEVGLNLLMCNRLCHSSVMMRKSFLQKHNLLYTKNYANAEDYELWVKIFLAGGKIALIGGHPIVIYHPSLHSEKWFATQDKSRDEIRMWAISRIVPKFERKMLRLSFCELLPIIIDGNKSTKVLNQEELEKQYVLKCQNVKKQRKGL